MALSLDPSRCWWVADRLSELLDGELEPAAAAGVALHLAACPGCARLALELAATVEALHRLPATGALPSCPLA